MNGDGRPDLVASGYCGLNVMLNRTPAGGSIVFDQPVHVSDPKQQSTWQSGIFALADINSDGKADVIVAENNYTAAGETSALNVFINETTASPAFRLAQRVPVGKRLTGVGVGDFNQDGWPDIATIDADGTLTFLLNDGQWKSKGAFTVHSSFTVMPNLQQLLLIDRLGGGPPRLLLRNQDSAAIIQ
ncbi:MAG: VCBS repeat-containing protein, partial [Candidatus Sulfotelmatobacter sp.]